MTLQTMQPEKMNQKHTQKRLHVFPSIHTHSQGSLWDHSWGFMQVGIFAK